MVAVASDYDGHYNAFVYTTTAWGVVGSPGGVREKTGAVRGFKKKFRQASHISDITSPTQEMVVQQLLIVDSLAWGIVQQEKLNMASALARQ